MPSKRKETSEQLRDDLRGDGSLLMNLGSLVTVAQAAPNNFFHFVFDNGVYEVNGSHPVPGAGKTDFAAMALAAGYRNAVVYDRLDDLKAGVAGFLSQTGPVIAVMKVERGKPYPRNYDYIHSIVARQKFRSALASS